VVTTRTTVFFSVLRRRLQHLCVGRSSGERVAGVGAQFLATIITSFAVNQEKSTMWRNMSERGTQVFSAIAAGRRGNWASPQGKETRPKGRQGRNPPHQPAEPEGSFERMIREYNSFVSAG